MRTKRYPASHTYRWARHSLLHRDSNSATPSSNGNSVLESKELEAQQNSSAVSVKNEIAAVSVQIIHAPIKNRQTY